MSFGTVVSCMDGRIHLPVINFLQERFGVDHIDKITEAGPVGIISEHPGGSQVKSIFRLIDISINSHASTGIAIVAHHDCAGNPIPDSDQKLQLQACLGIFAERYPGYQIIGLWLDEKLDIHEYSALE
jgi:carbonic anhydrase